MKNIFQMIIALIFLAAIPSSGYGEEASDLIPPITIENNDDFLKTVDSQNEDTLADDRDEGKEAVDKINEVMQKVFKQILASKSRYKELADFDEHCLVKNEQGFLTLKYEIQIPSARGESYPYAFFLTIEPIKSKTYTQYVGYFEYELPMLDLQFSGYLLKHPLRRQFDVERVLDENAEDLADFQQQFMPLRIVLDSTQKTFKVDEPIHFKVALVNMSEYNFLVNSLGQDTLFFTINNSEWGAQLGEMEIETLSPREQRMQDRIRRREIRQMMRRKKEQSTETFIGERVTVGDKIILRSGQGLKIDFVGAGFHRAQDVEIRGIYNLTVKGLLPTATLKLKIVK